MPNQRQQNRNDSGGALEAASSSSGYHLPSKHGMGCCVG